MKGPTPDAILQGEHLAKLAGVLANLNDTMDQLHTGMKTRDGVRQVGTQVFSISIPANATGNAGLVSNSPGLIAGINLRETAGIACVVTIYDGVDANGTRIWEEPLAANQGLTRWLLPGGISHTIGIFIVISGAAGAINAVLYRGDGKKAAT